MKVQSRMKFLLFIVVVFIFLFIYSIIPTKTALVFYEEHTNNIAAYLPIQKEQSFQIIFVHSIHLTDVVEKYQVTEENQIKQYEIVFEEFGIGMPSTVEAGEEFVYEDGKYHIKNLNNLFPSMKIRNGKTVSKHRLLWNDETGKEHMVYFNDYFEPGAWFTVKMDKISLLQSWKEVMIRD